MQRSDTELGSAALYMHSPHQYIRNDIEELLQAY